MAGTDETALASARALYIELLIRCVAGTIYQDPNISPMEPPGHDPARRAIGGDWPAVAHSMIGLRRLENLRDLVQAALREGIPGDFIETGIWRGGACILMRGILAAHGVTDRRVFAADSFRGLPPPDPQRFPADEGDLCSTFPQLAIPIAAVRDAFAAYGLLDDQVVFVEGWFEETLANLPPTPLALMRLDGDMYASTIQALEALYPRLSPGGFVIIDDWGTLANCRQAVEDYRARHDVTAPIQTIDWTGIWWRKPF